MLAIFFKFSREIPVSISKILVVFDLDLLMSLFGLQSINRFRESTFIQVNLYILILMAFENLDANSIILFLVGLLISTVVIYLVTLVLGHRRSLKLAFFTAIIGSIVYGISYALFGNGFLSAVLGGIAWLLALKTIYRMGWLKALIVAVIVWIITTAIGTLLPTAIGPL